jgi:hypothetical protein
LWRTCLAVAALALATMAAAPATGVAATVPPTTVPGPAPIATNDLLPANNNLSNCVGLAESANCGSKARADGHTYLVFLALAAGLTFIGWRVGRGVRARDKALEPTP